MAAKNTGKINTSKYKLIYRAMEFDLEYKIKQFREEQPELYNENNERYSTPIGKGTAVLMLEIINELESALIKAETNEQLKHDALLENVTERKEINCHSGTKVEELIAFVETNKGKAIEIHFENNFGNWGDDEILVYGTHEEQFYKEALKIIKTHYIHNIKCVG